jgi:transcriptional regulator with XRE-family HTH domain
MQFEKLYELRTQKRLTVKEAAEILGVHERTFRRWTNRYEEQGAEGLYDKRLNKISHNAASVDGVVKLLNLFETNYRNFNISHFYDMC